MPRKPSLVRINQSQSCSDGRTCKMSMFLPNIAKYLIHKLRVHEIEPRDTNVSKHYIKLTKALQV